MNDQKNDPVFGVPAAIVVAGIVIAGALFFRGGGNTVDLFKSQTGGAVGATGASAGNAEKPAVRPVDPATDHILGNPNAPVVVVEYSDLECPFCKAFHATMHQIMDQYGKDGKVAWVFREMPIPSLHPKAPHEAEAAECAAALGGNDKFWQFIDGVFAVTPSNNGLDPSELPAIAGQIGLDSAKFAACLSSEPYAARINADYENGVAAGAQGTPYSIVIGKNGQTAVINGAQPFEQVKATIDSLLAAEK